MNTESGHQYMPYCPMAPSKRSPSEIFGALDMSKIPGGSHSLPSKARSWFLEFYDQGNTLRNLHLVEFYDNIELHEAKN